MASDLNSILKKYLANLGKNEETITELTRDFRSWVLKNGEIVKDRIESQIDETAVRMGFAKTTEIDNLNARIAELESRLQAESVGEKKVISKPNRAPVKKSSTTKKVSRTTKASTKIKVTKKRVSK
jgi:polyhydroxyalkanoate synthesis regulator phasin